MKLPSGALAIIYRGKRTARLKLENRSKKGFFDFLDLFSVLIGLDGLFPLHASSFQHSEFGTALVVGASGAGKSTVLGAFLGDGAKFLADDRLAFGIKGGGVCIYPTAGVRKVNGSYVSQRVQALCGRPEVLIFPRVVKGETTSVKQCSNEWVAFRFLASQSYLVENTVRKDQLIAIRRLSRIPSYELVLGDDTKNEPQRLVSILKDGITRS